MLYGIRPDEQRRLARNGHTVRVYVPTARSGTGTSCGAWPSGRPT